jgi:hypothetical protein
MPFTPFHFGPGAAVKAVIPQHFSFTVFCFAQISMDCEVAYYMVLGSYPWHRFFHTYVGATFVAVFSVVVGRPVCQFALRIWSGRRGAPFQCFFPSSPTISWGSAISGAFIGAYSHVLLDSIMHPDIRPLMPFSEANVLYDTVGLTALHVGCVIPGLFAAIYLASKYKRNV